MTGFTFRRKRKYSISSIIQQHEKQRQINIKPCFSQAGLFKQLACTFSFLFGMEENDLYKTLSMILDALATIASMTYTFMKNVVKFGKKTVSNISLSSFDPKQNFKNQFFNNATKGNPPNIRMDGNDRTHLKLSSLSFPSNDRLNESGCLHVLLCVLFGKVEPKLVLTFEALLFFQATVKQVIEPSFIPKALRCIFELILDLEQQIKSLQYDKAHSHLAERILKGWNDGRIPKEGILLVYFLAFFIESLGIYVKSYINMTNVDSRADSKPTSEEKDEPTDKTEARSPVRTKAAIKDHMASLRQMWCEVFSDGLAEDMLCGDQERALRRFGKEQGLKQCEIDNILNESSRRLKEKGHALMHQWQQGQCGSIMRMRKALEDEHYLETIEALKRWRNSREDKETK